MREQEPQIPQANPENFPEAQFESRQQHLGIIERLRNSRVGVALAIGASSLALAGQVSSAETESKANGHLTPDKVAWMLGKITGTGIRGQRDLNPLRTEFTNSGFSIKGKCSNNEYNPRFKSYKEDYQKYNMVFCDDSRYHDSVNYEDDYFSNKLKKLTNKVTGKLPHINEENYGVPKRVATTTKKAVVSFAPIRDTSEEDGSHRSIKKILIRKRNLSIKWYKNAEKNTTQNP